MTYVQIYIYFQLFTIITTLFHRLYPCHYLDSTERILKCDLCQCLSSPSIYLPSNLCLLTSSIICVNNSNEEASLELSFPMDKQFRLNNFNNAILKSFFQYDQFCLNLNSSEIIFFNLIYNFSLNQFSTCLTRIHSLYFINSYLESNSLFSKINFEKLNFYNSTFDIENFNLLSTRILNFNFITNSFQLNSLPSLTDLTITYTINYNLIGLFPHLSYLNLCHTKLNDKKLNKIFSQINLPDLVTMILANNQLKSITNKFPSTIRYLDLSYNQIKSLDYYSFKNLYSLNRLNLSFNSPLEIQQDTFTRIPYLEILDLSYCLPSLPFDELFLPLQKLRHLNISANYLDSLPQLPVPHDAHTIESYDHHLPVLYIDISNNSFDKIDFEIFSSPSTYDKYILSINMNHNHLKTLKFPSILFNDTKRRGPFIELNINNNPLECDCNLHENIFQLFKNDHKENLPNSSQLNITKHPSSVNILSKQTRIKLLHLSSLTCIDMIEPINTRFLLELNSSNSYCSYNKSCPLICSCKHSYDLMNNYVNCSNRQLKQIPSDIPYSTTHLYLNNNLIKQMENNLRYLSHLKYLSLANNQLEYLANKDFSTMIKMENLDLSSNYIASIEQNLFEKMVNLKQLHLHNNLWKPKFYNGNREFQKNKRLVLLTYANGLVCNRTTISSSITLETPLTGEDCCKYSPTKSCQQTIKTNLEHNNNPISTNSSSSSSSSSSSFILLFRQKYRSYILISISLLIAIFLFIFTLYTYKKRRAFLSKRRALSTDDIQKNTNDYHKSYISSQQKSLNSNITYSHEGNDNSLSFTDEDDYASIPLTISQIDLTPVIRSQSIVPPLLPPRHFLFNRPISHSSTVSTSITGRNSSSLTTTRSCLQIKLDVLVLYSINDSKYIHENLGQILENLYSKRFSFHFIHRDRMLGELDWLIENSCVTILILRKPYQDYMKILSTCSPRKCFIILINNDQNTRITTIKLREKIARLYRTSNIYEWNSNSNSLIHEQLELFLEQNCGSATYVTD